MFRSSVALTKRFEVSAGFAPAGELTRSGDFLARLAATQEQRDTIYRLRFNVFNIELNEGLDSAFSSSRDIDEFDHFCDHVLIEHEPSGEIVGTYRMQSGTVASRALGYYSEREFDFTPYRHLAPKIVELGRACIVRGFRSYEVLALLWRAVALYAKMNDARYLIGCSSVTSQNPGIGWGIYERLRRYEVACELRTTPTSAFALPDEPPESDGARIPKLLRAYLAVGAKICGPPALDREFKTIDFLTLLDMESMSATARAHFFR
ncbi:MAG TPA: GNAT family N-acyltransferase [Terriglobales bacterium]|nr:GNAT family N-acyltransferase [Terriglobales bacterium]